MKRLHKIIFYQLILKLIKQAVKRLSGGNPKCGAIVLVIVNPIHTDTFSQLFVIDDLVLVLRHDLSLTKTNLRV